MPLQILWNGIYCPFPHNFPLLENSQTKRSCKCAGGLGEGVLLNTSLGLDNFKSIMLLFSHHHSVHHPGTGITLSLQNNPGFVHMLYLERDSLLITCQIFIRVTNLNTYVFDTFDEDINL